MEANLSVWGDSITKGVVFDEARGRYAICRENCLTMLSRLAGVRIANHSVMGQTSRVGLERMRQAALEPGAIAVIEYGGNDCDLDWKAVSEHPEEMQYGNVPVADFVKNLTEMVACARGAGMRPVLVTPPPLVSERYYEWVCRGLNRANILKYLGDVDHIGRWQANYAEQVRLLAHRLNVQLVDIGRWMADTGELERMMCVDGIHPNANGHAFLYRQTAALLG